MCQCSIINPHIVALGAWVAWGKGYSTACWIDSDIINHEPTLYQKPMKSFQIVAQSSHMVKMSVRMQFIISFSFSKHYIPSHGPHYLQSTKNVLN
jgi:hypothetical protein